MAKKSSKQRLMELQQQQKQQSAQVPAPGCRIDKHAKQRRKLLDITTSDRYYRSENVSALGLHSAADSTLKPGEKPVSTAPPLPPIASSDLIRSADNAYYRARPSGATKQQNTRSRQADVSDLAVHVIEDVRGVVDKACELLTAGYQRVRIEIMGEPTLALNVRTQLDARTVQGRLTEEQSANVDIDVTRAGLVPNTATPDELFGKPVPAQRPAEEKLFLNDPADFLASDDVIQTAPALPAVNDPIEEDDEDEDTDELFGDIGSTAKVDELFAPAQTAPVAIKKSKSHK